MPTQPGEYDDGFDDFDHSPPSGKREMDEEMAELMEKIERYKSLAPQIRIEEDRREWDAEAWELYDQD